MMTYFENAFKGLNDWWRYIVVLIVIFLGYTIGQIPLSLALLRAINEDGATVGTEELENFNSNPDFSVFGINSNMGFTLLLVMFVAALTAFFFIFRPLHQREFRSLVTASSKIKWGKIIYGFTFWMALSLAFELVAYAMAPESYTFRFQWNLFIPLLIISLLILPIQTSMEELLFRGYLMQGFAIATKTKWIPLIITSLLFGLIHSMNPEISEFGYGVMQVYYISAGLVLGIMTIMDDGLELALGVHAATNFTGAVFLGYEGAAIQTESLFVTSELNPQLMTAGFMIISVIFLLVTKYKYNWGSFSAIFEKVEKPDEDSLVLQLKEDL